MEHYAGIDVSLELSSVCVVDATGRILKEAKISMTIQLALKLTPRVHARQITTSA
jgi:hypothetical protein